ncbi:WYL domain-containing protein, partial [Thioclava sp. BHET1]
RHAIRQGRKLRLSYRAESGAETERVIWPVILGISETTRILIAWCELREDFRHFRLDRILTMEVTDAPHGLRPGELRRRWHTWREMQPGREPL